MAARSFAARLTLAAALGCVGIAFVPAQQPAPLTQSAAQPEEPPPPPQGVEVMTRGPVHEAFATPATEPAPGKPLAKQPPRALEEMPPETKPEGNVVWIGGYWAWDDDRSDFLWVSGVWRTLPPGKHWVAGYWRDDAGQSTWVPGFWAAAAAEGAEQEVTYLPEPPKPPEVAPPSEKPADDSSFFVPGNWVYANGTYAWRAGYWARVQPGYVWVPAHYRWTPSGHVFIPGYWDMAISRRGVMYAPVFVDVRLVGPGYVYTPAYAVPETVVVDYMFVRPCYCHYYFGDYYGPTYREYGFESCVIYSRTHYEPIFVYERWDHRREPAWESSRLEICIGCNAGRIAPPPRVLVQRNVTVVNVTNVHVTNVTMVTTTSAVAAAHGSKVVVVDTATRVQAKQQAQSIQQVSVQRQHTEVPLRPGEAAQPRVAGYSVPKPQSVAAGMKAAAPSATPAARPLTAAPVSNTAPRPTNATTASSQSSSGAAKAGTHPGGTPIGQSSTGAGPTAAAHPGTTPASPAGTAATANGQRSGQAAAAGQPARPGQPPARPPQRAGQQPPPSSQSQSKNPPPKQQPPGNSPP